jgi:hypothetical protein
MGCESPRPKPYCAAGRAAGGALPPMDSDGVSIVRGVGGRAIDGRARMGCGVRSPDPGCRRRHRRPLLDARCAGGRAGFARARRAQWAELRSRSAEGGMAGEAMERKGGRSFFHPANVRTRSFGPQLPLGFTVTFSTYSMRCAQQVSLGVKQREFFECLDTYRWGHALDRALRNPVGPWASSVANSHPLSHINIDHALAINRQYHANRVANKHRTYCCNCSLLATSWDRKH